MNNPCQCLIPTFQLDKSQWIFVPDAIIRDKTLTPLEKILFGLIGTETEIHGACYGSNKELASMLGVGPQSISTGINRLKKLGFIQVGVAGPRRKLTLSQHVVKGANNE